MSHFEPKVRPSGDEGAALAMVLVMLVVLSTLMAAVGFLSQSSNSIVRTNVTLSTQRSALVSGSLSQALQDLSTATSGRIGTWDNSCESASNMRYEYADSQTGHTIGIQCIQSADSGKEFPIASFVLTGTGCNSGVEAAPEYVTAPDICGSLRIGEDGGLSLGSVGAIVASGGFINASGAWNSTVTPDELKLTKLNADAENPMIIQPNNSDGLCPASQFGSTCECPTSFQQAGSCDTSSPFSMINPNSPATKIGSYLDSIAQRLSPAPTQAASIENWPGAIGTPPTCASIAVTEPSTGALVVKVNPGTMSQSFVTSLNNLMSATGAGRCGNGLNGNPAVWFSGGVYRLIGTDPSNINTLVVPPGVMVVGGLPVTVDGGVSGKGVWDCKEVPPGSSDPNGVQLQFQGFSSLTLGPGRMALCPMSEMQPVLAAPLYTAANAYSLYRLERHLGGSKVLVPMLDASGGSACTGVGPSELDDGSLTAPNLTWLGCGNLNFFRAHGLVYAPGGSAKLKVNGAAYISFTKGAVFRGMYANITGSAAVSPKMLPPPPFNGDRKVQLRFWDKTAGVETDFRNLGLVQYVILDYFGRHPASGYRTLRWRTAW